LTQKYEEAIATLKTVLTRSPGFLYAHVLLAIIFGGADRMEEARAEVSEVLRINPNYSLEALKEMCPFKDQASSQKMIETLRKAGLG
jgi:adenylate cyclase